MVWNAVKIFTQNLGFECSIWGQTTTQFCGLLLGQCELVFLVL
jgi:hypothetical protein